jgi:16S rRNA (cytosine1402-N4)-methyltransferase
MARVFQALRIEVNKEMEVLEALLRQSLEVLNPGGRLVILTYHSLEDRLVKNYFRTGNFEGKLEKDFYGNIISPLKAVNNKVIVASDEEIFSETVRTADNDCNTRFYVRRQQILLRDTTCKNDRAKR